MIAWAGPLPDMCQIGGETITDTFIDGVTMVGSWAILCPACHKTLGVGLGTGRGQMYVKQPDGRWVKTGG